MEGSLRHNSKCSNALLGASSIEAYGRRMEKHTKLNTSMGVDEDMPLPNERTHFYKNF